MRTNTLVKYQCWTTLKPLLKFYVILCSIMAMVYFLLLNFSIASGKTGGTNGTETACIIYLCVTGSLGFNEDFKMAIQNGFTRKQIFIAAMGMFGFVSLLMASIDTLVGTFLQTNTPYFTSLITQLFGHDQSFFIHWISLFMFYFMAATFAYFGSLLCNKVGKNRFFIGFIGLGLFLMLVLPLLISIYASQAFIASVFAFIGKWLTFQQGLYPLITFTCAIVIVVIFSYLIVTRSEIK